MGPRSGDFAAQGSFEDGDRQEGRERERGSGGALRQGVCALSESVIRGGDRHLLRAPPGEPPPAPRGAPQGLRAECTGAMSARSTARALTAPGGFCELQVTRDRPDGLLRTARGIGSAAVPTRQPEPLRVGPGHIVRCVMAKPGHGLGPRPRRAETLSPSRGAQPTSRAELKWDGVAEGFPLFWPAVPNSFLSPKRLGRAPRTAGRKGWNRGTLQRLRELGLHPKVLEDVARVQAEGSLRGTRGRSSSWRFRNGISGKRRRSMTVACWRAAGRGDVPRQ